MRLLLVVYVFFLLCGASQKFCPLSISSSDFMFQTSSFSCHPSFIYSSLCSPSLSSLPAFLPLLHSSISPSLPPSLPPSRSFCLFLSLPSSLPSLLQTQCSLQLLDQKAASTGISPNGQLVAVGQHNGEFLLLNYADLAVVARRRDRSKAIQAIW